MQAKSRVEHGLTFGRRALNLAGERERSATPHNIVTRAHVHETSRLRMALAVSAISALDTYFAERSLSRYGWVAHLATRRHLARGGLFRR
ncbi:MAG: hypothetical protein QOH95_364 [Gaiellaceae bacterium]|jgi:hypothetical protein|nr:hypothetical protein [Gaiellaceae bacterium]